MTEGFTYEYFRSLYTGKKKLSAKAFPATEQRIPGLGNGALQDILWDAGIDPRFTPEKGIRAGVMNDWRSMPREDDYVVNSDILSRLGDIFRKYNIGSWQNILEGIMAMDAAVTTFTFRFADMENSSRDVDGTSEELAAQNYGYAADRITFKSDQELPNEAFDAIDEIKAVLEDYCKENR